MRAADPAPPDDSAAELVPPELVLAARARLARSIQPPSGRDPEAASRLIALAERVRAKLRPPAPQPVAEAVQSWPSGCVTLADFVTQWLATGGDAVDWLPVMSVGSAGEKSDAGVSARPGEVGHLVYGPYARLGWGEYCLRWRSSAGASPGVPPGQRVATIEAVTGDGKTYLAQRHLSLEDCAGAEQELRFRITARAAPVEVRVWTSGAVPLTISSITVARTA